MTKIRLKGFCPKIEFETFQELHPEKVSKNASEVLKVLGDRPKAFLYAPKCHNYGISYITLVLLTTNKLAMDVAKEISIMLPNHPIHDEGRKVLIHDVLSPGQIPDVTVVPSSAYTFVLSNPESGFRLMQNSSYLVAIRNNEQYAEMFIYRKIRI